ncbi:MAG: hypothetical protein KDA74_23220, partial [Planctomycetaceae bacterium]|nr:hypothetical protein [Planctomycetaceae bacterium]
LSVGMVVSALLGFRVGRRRFLSSPETARVSTSTVDAAILSLLGLLVAFTFSSAYSRYNMRRDLIVEEVNAIGTAYLRLDLLPTESRDKMQNLFRDYVDSRIRMWHLLADRQAALAENENAERLQNQIWQNAIEATAEETHGDARKLLLPVLNDMIDLTTKRLTAIQSHPPMIIACLLGLTALAAAWIIGFGMSKSEAPSYLHLIGFSLVVTLSFYVILDLEYLRFGLVTLDTPHELLVELKTKFQTAGNPGQR